jgi:hypothetical protein
MPQAQNIRRGRAVRALLLALAQDGTALPANGCQEAAQGVSYAAPHHNFLAKCWHNGSYCGPYKGFYPCNAKTPYCGGACAVYGDAPIYSAPADYGHHIAAHCP